MYDFAERHQNEIIITIKGLQGILFLTKENPSLKKENYDIKVLNNNEEEKPQTKEGNF
jgi:hypothetical protein